MSQPALSLHLFDPEHGLHASARTGATLLFEGSTSEVLAEGPRWEAAGDGWRAALDERFDVGLERVAPTAEIDGVSVSVCAVTGSFGGRDVSCLGTVSETREPPAWEALDALRSISALFDREHAVLAIGRRPAGAVGHGTERTVAWVLREGEPKRADDARISTVYDGEGRQRSAGLELWMADEDHPVRMSGTVIAGSSLALEAVDVHAAVFRWRLEDREGTGAYELMARAERRTAA